MVRKRTNSDWRPSAEAAFDDQCSLGRVDVILLRLARVAVRRADVGIRPKADNLRVASYRDVRRAVMCER